MRGNTVFPGLLVMSSISLSLYNRFTQKKEVFSPNNPDRVTMYVCGPTVYGPIHMGNGRSVVVFDVLFRVLRYLFSKVTYVRNITDVDDKINAQAKMLEISISDLTKQTTAQFHQDIEALHVLPVTVEPKATQHIPHMIAVIQALLDKGMAYISQGHVLFDVLKDSCYGALSGAHAEEILAGARVEIAPYKRNPQDFVLWKPVAEDDQEFWSSPWGDGRPGWHTECAAMSREYLGVSFDIHGGGADLLFPHHENENAQSRNAWGVSCPVKHWVHNGMLMIDGQKMSKSLGNVLLLKDALTQYSGSVIRWALLSSHYRHTLDWSASLLHQATQCVESVNRVLELPWDGKLCVDADILAYLCDDLNTPGALNSLHLLAKRALHDPDWVPAVHTCAQFLGIHGASICLTQEARDKIEKLVKEREYARGEKNFQYADELRKELENLGIVLEDNAQGTIWHKRV
ncbi:cysteine--tRNA ligase [Holospora obtusa F1]|uniref:Cysteine--tRNA ligase n=1 Tax=Holospora obtusa F1 TaxID=1399147 RepID=W6TUP9_HOLOB|nr:cysteine--tRNA ligase [Holospora obtusa]ETZ07462.1 cysteine--tRNA ligase [Holospora obtusa F1]